MIGDNLILLVTDVRTPMLTKNYLLLQVLKSLHTQHDWCGYQDIDKEISFHWWGNFRCDLVKFSSVRGRRLIDFHQLCAQFWSLADIYIYSLKSNITRFLVGSVTCRCHWMFPVPVRVWPMAGDEGSPPHFNMNHYYTYAFDIFLCRRHVGLPSTVRYLDILGSTPSWRNRVNGYSIFVPQCYRKIFSTYCVS
jgi:hypothetical protein